MAVLECDREIIVLTRAPIAGRTKTRLMPDLSADQCARLHAAFLHDLGKMARKAALACGARVSVLVDPFSPSLNDVGSSLFGCAMGEAGFERKEGAVAAVDAVVREAFGGFAAYGPQRGGGLGDRMAAAFSDAFGRGAAQCVLIGSDSPELPEAVFVAAFEALSSADCVFAPSLDGGYCLVGMSAPHPGVFDIAGYGGPTVLGRTLARARALGLSCATLAPFADIDDSSDLSALATRLREQRRFALRRGDNEEFPMQTLKEIERLAAEGVDAANGEGD